MSTNTLRKGNNVSGERAIFVNKLAVTRDELCVEDEVVAFKYFQID